MSGSPKEAWAELQTDEAACPRSHRKQMVGRAVGRGWRGEGRVYLLLYCFLHFLLLAQEGLLNRALPLLWLVLRLAKILKPRLSPGERLQDRLVMPALCVGEGVTLLSPFCLPVTGVKLAF